MVVREVGVSGFITRWNKYVMEPRDEGMMRGKKGKMSRRRMPAY